jgi:Mrp family chromosome partitioning ATPase
LLDSQRMAGILDELARRADLIVIDSPPMLSVADATILASRVDGVLLVVDAGYTRRAMVKRAKESLLAIGANIVGVVVNRASIRSESDYYYDYSYSPEASDKKRKFGKSRGRAGAAPAGGLAPVKLTKPAVAPEPIGNGAVTERAK